MGVEEMRFAAAAALARGLGAEGEGRVDFAEMAMKCYERGREGEALEVVGGEAGGSLALLRRMLASSRCLSFAPRHLFALPLLPPPSPATLLSLGSAAMHALSGLGEGPPPQLVELIRSSIERALLADPYFLGAEVHAFGSAALGLGGACSDVDCCLLLPSHPTAHARDAQGRKRLKPLLVRMAHALRGGGMGEVQVVSEGRTPLLRLEMGGDGWGGGGRGGERGRGGEAGGEGTSGLMRSVCVELCVNNTNGLANFYLLSELLAVAPVLAPMIRFVRGWARGRALCGVVGTPSAYSWGLMAAYAAQRAGCLPLLAPDANAFAALLTAPPPPHSTPQEMRREGEVGCAERSEADATLAPPSGPPSAAAWTQLARSSLVVESNLEHALAAASVHSPSTSPLARSACSPPPNSSREGGEVLRRTLGQLLWHFFLTWASEFSYRQHVASLRQVGKRKAGVGWARRDATALMLEDPVETDRDLGRYVNQHALRSIRIEAARALIDISDSSNPRSPPASVHSTPLPPSAFGWIQEESDWRLSEHREVLGTARVSQLLPPPRAHQIRVEVVNGSDGVARMLAALDGRGVVAIDCEGEGLSRTGRVCLIQLAAEGTPVFLIDLLCHDAATAVRAIAPLLESSAVLKLAHDCRQDASALLHQHGIRLAHLFDTQACS
ncbi:MAG: hypothetical protein SGPRY_008832 [Prymnesium sp.]